MNLNNFALIAEKIVQTLESHDNTANYQNLVSYLTTGRTSPTPEIEQSIKEALALIEQTNQIQQATLDSVPHTEYVLEKLGIEESIGTGATNKLNNILKDEIFNAPSSIEKFVSEINASLTQLKTILTEMSKFGIEFETHDSALLSIEYLGSYEVEDTEQLKLRLTDIESIVRAYARLTDQPEAFKKPRIVSISKSSPLTIDIGDGVAIYSTLILVAKGITWAMSRVEQAVRIRIEFEELKQKKITSKNIEKEFRSLEEAETSEANIKNFVNELYKDKGSKAKTTNGVENETKKDLLEATKLLVKMIEGGASIKVYPPETPDSKENSDVGQLVELNLAMSASYKTISNEQYHLKLLEDKANKPHKKATKKDATNGTT